MSEQEKNICPRCGGVKRVEYVIIFVDGVPYEMRIDAQDLPTETGWHLCPGHPEPAQRHDGNLNTESTHNVYYNNFGGVAIHANDAAPDTSVTWMSASEALSLLAWLQQERDALARLAKEQEQ